MLLTPHAWCSPSQWGEGSATIAWLGMLGLSVAHRAFRSDVSLAFLGSWIALKAARVLYLEQKLPVLLHQLSVGSLILFTFFMISDPKTTPDSKKGRGQHWSQLSRSTCSTDCGSTTRWYKRLWR